MLIFSLFLTRVFTENKGNFFPEKGRKDTIKVFTISVL